MSVCTKPKVAVLLAAYNGMQWIEEQVDSILNQRAVNISLFISVDLSSDGTELWVQKLSDQTENIHFLDYGERFGGAGANFYRLIRDVQFAGFDYISFSDQDDIWFDTKIKRACNLLDSNSYDVYSSDVIAFWSNGKTQLIKKSYPQKKYDYFFEAAGPGCTYVFNLKSALALQQFVRDDRNLQEKVTLHDWLAYAFCRHNGLRWFIDDWPSMLYRQHDRNQVGINEGYKAYIKRFNLVRRRWYRKQVLCISYLIDPSWSNKLSGFFFRLVNFYNFRRRTRDRIVLAFMLFLGFF